MRNRALPTVLLVFFFGMVGYSLTILFTPLFITPNPTFISPHLSLGVRTIFFGLVMFLYPFGQFCSSPILGALSDRYGRRPFLISSVAVMVVAYFLIAWALQTQVISLLMVALFLAGLSGGNVVIAFSVVADLVEKKQRGRFFGYIYLFRSLGFVLGPLIGGMLTNPEWVSWFSIATPFWVVFFLLLIAFFWMLFFFPETLKEEHQEKIHLFQAFTNIKGVFSSKNLRLIFLVNFLVYLSIYGFFRSFPMYIVYEFELSISKLSAYVAFLNVPIILISLFAMGWITKRFTFKTILIVGSVLSGLCILMVTVPETRNGIWLPIFFVGCSFALALPSTNALLSSLVDQRVQGRVLGNNQSLQVLGEALSALAAGLLGSILMELSIYIFGLTLIFAAIILSLVRPSYQEIGAA